MNKYKRTLLLSLTLLLLPAICFADGGGPLLLIMNAYVFIIGQVWILLAEFIYLSVLLKSASLSKGRVFKITFIMNILSTLIGALLFPFLLALLTLPGTFYMGTKWGGLLMAFGTWIVGDNSPYSAIAIGVTIAGFIITFILTVGIEYKYLKWLSRRKQIEFGDNLLGHCISFNIISYAGLITLLFIFQNIRG